MRRRIAIRFPWRRIVATVETGFWPAARGYVAIVAHELLWSPLRGHVGAHRMAISRRLLIGVSNAPYEILDVVGFPPNPQAVGQFRLVVKDIVWTSDGANEVPVAVIAAVRFGLRTIFGAHYLGSDSDIVSITDSAYIITPFISNNALDIGVRDTDGALLDLDDEDVAAIRVAVWGI